jgi:prepilin peptidase dependent protein D
MAKCDGFTLVELMIVVIIIALLAAIGLPTYQQYTQKAAMTDLLQSMLSYKSAVELCALELGNSPGAIVSRECMQGKNGIPDRYQNPDTALGYTQSISVAAHGIITLAGQRSLTGLTVILIPGINSLGTIQWFKQCQSDNESLTHSCQVAFKFKDLP